MAVAVAVAIAVAVAGRVLVTVCVRVGAVVSVAAWVAVDVAGGGVTACGGVQLERTRLAKRTSTKNDRQLLDFFMVFPLLAAGI